MDTVRVGCPNCYSKGMVLNKESLNAPETCLNCDGSGYIILKRVPYKSQCDDKQKDEIMEREEKQVCSCCGGTGYIEECLDDQDEGLCSKDECACCNGTGYSK